MKRLGTLVVPILLLCSSFVLAQQTVATNTNPVVPPLVNFSGTLTDGDGKPITAAVAVTFTLYSEQTWGASLWMETQKVQPDTQGHYSALLGSTSNTGLPSEIFVAGEAHWLGVQVEGQPEQPRVMLLSVPYALKAGDAQTVGGLPPSAFVRSDLSPETATGQSSPTVQSGKASALPPTISGSGTTNYIPIWTSSTALGNSVIYQTGGNVGVGTKTPSSLLDVSGSVNSASGFKIAGTQVVTFPGGNIYNLALGYYALVKNTTGNDNTATGAETLSSNTSGSLNTATGLGALYYNTTGNSNTATGMGALEFGSTGSNNTATGYIALGANTASYNTADGFDALGGNTTGTYNTAAGAYALETNVSGSNNTATGYSALFNNNAGSNTATGYNALYSNTTGGSNTADGVGALYSNVSGSDNTTAGFQSMHNATGSSNTAAGYQALNNTTGNNSTAVGYQALYSSTAGDNTAIGYQSLYTNTTGNSNAAVGENALLDNTSGSNNTAIGSAALLKNTAGASNTALGELALETNTTGNNNIAVGSGAAASVSAGNSNNIHIGSAGSSGDSAVIRIGTLGTQTSFFVAGVSGVTTGVNDAVPVLVDTNGQLGTVSSSIRFKEDVQDMGDASRGLMRLRPVTFRYKKPFANGFKPTQYGLIAEEVAEVYPDLVARSSDGQIETVKYQVLDSMLLNEIQRQQTEIRSLQEQMASLKAALASMPENPRVP